VSGLARVRAQDLEGARLIRLDGEIDLSNAQEVLEDIVSQLPADSPLLVLDLSDTGYLDSSGIAMLFRLARRLGTSRQGLRLVVPKASRIRAVIDLTAVDRVIAVHETVSDASASGGP
jgi:anti-anti-sigma factor